MPDRLIALHRFANQVDAHAARVALESEGIRATVSDEETTGNLWYLSPALGGVKVYVHEADVERALALLEAAKFLTPGEKSLSSWKCPACGETVPGDFDVCWSCGRAYDAAALRTAADDAPDEDPQVSAESAAVASAECGSCGAAISSLLAQCPACGAAIDTSNPYTSTVAPRVFPPASDEMNYEARRAFIAAVLGMTCPIVANFYSIYLVFQVFPYRQRLSSGARAMLYAAIAIDVAVVSFLILVFVLKRFL